MLGKQATDVISKNQGGGWGGKEAQLPILCFSFLLSSSKMFLPSETWRQGAGVGWGVGGDVNYFTTPSWFPEEATARPPGAQGCA